MILLDGKKLAQKIKDELKQKISTLGLKLRLAIVMAGEDAATLKFIEQKKKIAEELGIEVHLFGRPSDSSTESLRRLLAKIVHDEKNTGVIIQLPLPALINTQYVLNAVPPAKDIDMLSARSLGNFIVGKSPILPPVVGAIKTLLEEYAIPYKNKYMVIVGAGKLVGRPLAIQMINEGVTVSVVTESTLHPEEFLRKADIIVSGAGRPGIITEDLIKDGAVVIDAGTSESGGRVVGDVDFESVSKKASYISPVPGGVGPLTVGMLFKNLVTLADIKKK